MHNFKKKMYKKLCIEYIKLSGFYHEDEFKQ